MTKFMWYQNTKSKEIVYNCLRTKQAKNADPLTAELIKIKQDLAIWRGLKDPKDVYAIFPYKLRID